MPIVLISSNAMPDFPNVHEDMLKKAGFQVRITDNPCLGQGHCTVQETIDELCGVAAVIAWGEVYSDEVLSALPELRVVARHGVGYDHIDLDAATAHNIVLTITPTANHEAVAEHALALMMAVARLIVVGDKDMRSGQWFRRHILSLRNKTLGIVGLGRIGRSMAVRALAMGMKVVATELAPVEEFLAQHPVELIDLDVLLATADFVTLHCPLMDQTRGLIDKQNLAKMKKGSILINTARGGLVVESDLVEALTSGHLLGAGLDVFETEPINPDNPLLSLENVVVSPHIASSDDVGVRDMQIQSAQCIIDLYHGKWPGDAVLNQQLKGRWKW